MDEGRETSLRDCAAQGLSSLVSVTRSLPSPSPVLLVVPVHLDTRAIRARSRGFPAWLACLSSLAIGCLGPREETK